MRHRASNRRNLLRNALGMRATERISKLVAALGADGSLTLHRAPIATVKIDSAAPSGLAAAQRAFSAASEPSSAAAGHGARFGRELRAMSLRDWLSGAAPPLAPATVVVDGIPVVCTCAPPQEPPPTHHEAWCAISKTIIAAQAKAKLPNP